jgi:glucose-1-phosphate thymidylyltransferase
MKLIIPMAGMGKRMRPHTLTIPKPLIKVAGKPIVEHLVEDIAKVCPEPITEINFITGRFGIEVENNLIKIASGIGAKGLISYQDEALGTAHAILCASQSLNGKVVVAFADTLFKADFKLDMSTDGIIWTSHVEDPSSFGVVKINERGLVEAFVEKPDVFISDQAIIGIYYFKDGERLHRELQRLIDLDIRVKGGEFGITDALENMKNTGVNFKIEPVTEWLDCGNKDATVFTNQRVLALKHPEGYRGSHVILENSIVIEPCYLADHSKIKNAIVGPFVTIGPKTVVDRSVISNSIIQSDTHIKNAVIDNSMVGSSVHYTAKADELSVGDYNTLKQ